MDLGTSQSPNLRTSYHEKPVKRTVKFSRKPVKFSRKVTEKPVNVILRVYGFHFLGKSPSFLNSRISFSMVLRSQ